MKNSEVDISFDGRMIVEYSPHSSCSLKELQKEIFDRMEVDEKFKEEMILKYGRKSDFDEIYW